MALSIYFVDTSRNFKNQTMKSDTNIFRLYFKCKSTRNYNIAPCRTFVNVYEVNV